MSLREELQAAVTEAYALLNQIDEVWARPNTEFEVLSDLYDDLAGQGDGIVAYAGQLAEGANQIVDLQTAAEDAQNEALAAAADLAKNL